MIDERKYVTFKREDIVGPLAFWPSVAPYEIEDAVVIRRQDLFASPALATYSACIAIAASMTNVDDEQRQKMLDVADYFDRQAQLAAEEGFKLPNG